MEECLRWAAKARSDEKRDMYLQLAKTWHEAAKRLEEGIGVIRENKDLLERSKN
jgi:hypothetical protein